MRSLLDTNIVIDALIERQPFYEYASAIFDLAAGEYFKAYLTASTMTDIYYLLRKHYPDGETRDIYEILWVVHASTSM